jgi:hypothetical protein
MLILQSRSGNMRRRRLKRLLWIALPLLAVAAWLSWSPLLVRYHLWKQRNALRQAKEFIAQDDPNDAHLALEVAFTVAPGNIEAWRTAADMLEQVGTAEAVRIRRHIVQMMGANLNDQVALINCAIRFRDYNVARDALSSISRGEATQPAALGAALSFALATENAPVADALFDRLKVLIPNNDDFKVAQSVLHLRHPNPKEAAAARSELEADAANPKYALRVERELTADAMVRQDYLAAKRWSAKTLADPKADLSDRLQQANLELLIDKKPFAQVFPPLAASVGSNPAEIVPFVHWILVQNHGAEADQWLAQLPPSIRGSAAFKTAQADVVIQLKDWDRLAPMLEAGALGPLSPESARLAMSARLVGARNPALQHEVWQEAIDSANGNLVALLVLEHLATIWQWDAESERTLWTIARAFPDQTWVHQELFNIYRTRNDTANMRELMNVLRMGDPSVPRYQHDWALFSLLLDPTPEWDGPKEIMRQLYTSDPTNPNYATGYAFALARAGKGPQSLAIVAKLSPAERDYSPRSPYLAYVYGINGKKGEVEHMEALSHGTPYLPEERLLFTLAREAEDHRVVPAFVPPKPTVKS